MDDKIQLQKHAGILSAQGKHLGSLERVVVNPETNVVTDIVVRTGGLLRNEEKVVSINLVNGTTVDYILLNEGPEELAEFPDFEQEQPVVEGGEDVDTSEISGRRSRIAIPGNPFVSIPIMPVANGRAPEPRRQAWPQSLSNSVLQLSQRVTTLPEPVTAKS